MFDLPSDWNNAESLPNTYCRGGVYDGMQGTDITRIDTIFANAVAAHGCTSIVYLWIEGTGFDHVPIRAVIDADA